MYRRSSDVFARCECGFEFVCGDTVKPNPDPEANSVIRIPLEDFEPTFLYPYCPKCGAKKIKYTPDVEKLDKDWLKHEYEKYIKERTE